MHRTEWMEMSSLSDKAEHISKHHLRDTRLVCLTGYNKGSRGGFICSPPAATREFTQEIHNITISLNREETAEVHSGMASRQGGLLRVDLTMCDSDSSRVSDCLE